MNAPTPNTGGAPTPSLTAEARQFLSRRFIERTVALFGMQEVFMQSMSWKGYERACDSWHNALWGWVDQETPANVARKVEAWHGSEQSRQEYLLNRAFFLLVMHGPDAEEWETYQRFLGEVRLSEKIGDDTFFRGLAKHKQRKPSKDKDDRRLKYLLLLCWIPGCLWAFTTEGVAEFLQARYPRSQGQPYHPKSISDACRDLKLYRSPLPLWWGMSAPPPRLVSLR